MPTLSWTQKAKIAWMIFFHRKTPFAAKATILGGLLYGLLPFDLLPDFLPLIGLVDDATFLIFMIMAFLHLTKKLRKNLEQKNDIIDVEKL